MAKSAARSGVFGPKTSIRMPLRQTVWRRLVPGCGPRSRSRTIGATASGTVAAIRVRRSSFRLMNPLASAPSVKVFSNSARCSGLDASGWRSSVCSTLGIRYRTQMTAPTASAPKATDIDKPSARLERRVPSTERTCSPT